MPLGNLRGTGDFGKSSQANGVSPDGQAVVGVSLSSAGLGATRGEEAFLWVKPGPMRGLDALVATRDRVFQRGAGCCRSGPCRGRGNARRTKGDRPFAGLRRTGWSRWARRRSTRSSIAHGVSADGKTIVGAQGKVAFRWTEEQGMTSLGTCPAVRKKYSHGDLVRWESRRRLG